LANVIVKLMSPSIHVILLTLFYVKCTPIISQQDFTTLPHNIMLIDDITMVMAIFINQGLLKI